MKKAVAALMVLLIAMQLSGCFLQGKPAPSKTAKQINPNEEASTREKVAITLYFQYGNEFFLAGEQRVIDAPVNGRLEVSALRELIKGPSPDSKGLTALLAPDIRVAGISESGEYLFVTLSREFLPQAPNALTDEDRKRRQLAVYAIANTLIELGGYSRVQILVDIDGTGLGQRVKMSDAGIGDAGEALLEPVGFKNSVVLDPKNTVAEFLKSYAGKDYERMYAFIASRDFSGDAKPSEEEFLSGVVSFNSGIEEYSVVDDFVAADGVSGVVLVNFNVKRKNGALLEKTDTPLKLIREENIWKISYDSFKRVFQL